MVTRFKAFLARIRLAWRLSADPRMPMLLVLSRLLDSRTYEAAHYAVHKCGLDTSLKAAHNETLRAEAVQWAGHYSKEHGISAHPWEVRICLELAVGKLKGYL